MASGLKLTYEEVSAYFKNQGCELLEAEYKNARTKMKYRCTCGNLAAATYGNFREGNRCRDCGSKRASDKMRLSHEFVENYFRSQNCELLDEYVANLKPIKYRCECGNIANTSWCNFRSGKRCWECGVAKRSGDKHYEWREDRDLMDSELMFRQRSYKLVKMSLNVTGRVKNDKTAKLLGYDYKQLQEHITSHQNWPEVKDKNWHVDHIFPIKAFIDAGISDLKIINALDNLRPLDAVENMSKNAKYDRDEFSDWLRTKGIELNKEVSV